MLNIYDILDKLGFDSQTRAISAKFSNTFLNKNVFVQRVDGHQEINSGLNIELLALSVDSTIPLKQFMGCQVAIDTVTDTGQLFRTTGLITEASQGQSDGSLTVYKLQLKDATALWQKRRNQRVFMNKSCLDIIQILFKEWQERSPLFAASLTLSTERLHQDYDVRPFTMQTSAESEYEFITRLLKSEGINFFIDETESFVRDNSAPIQPQKLCLIDDNHQFEALTRQNIRFHRSDATEPFDTITQFIAQRKLQPTAVHVQRWQPNELNQQDGAGSVLSYHQHSEQHDNESLSLEDAWHISPAWMQDLNGEDGATASSRSQLEHLNDQLSKQHNLNAKYFTAYSTVRDAKAGYWFKFHGHPEIDQHHESEQEFLILNKHFYNQNNLPKDIQKQVQYLLTESHWHNKNHEEEAQRQGNCLTLIRRSIDVVPSYHPEQDKPVAHVQRAQVVGSAGEQIHVDEWGRIKVRFLFSRAEDNAHDGGAGSNHSDTDSAWVDVLTPWAGDGYGARFLPRVGEIVVIDFFDGNIDRPFVMGRLHEAERTPTQFDRKGKLPHTKKLSGIRSQEVDGSGFNQLRFDDTTGQISTQLQSSHAVSQLNLGHLSHPKDQATSQGRGEGFELRTDALGAVRAGRGLLLSTHEDAHAKQPHADAATTKKQLQGSLDNTQALNEIAQGQQVDPLDMLENLKAFLNQIEQEDQDKAKVFKEAVILLASPKDVALSSHENIFLSADGQINHSAGDSINVSTQKNVFVQAQEKISLFAAQQGARLFAGLGNVEIQAHGGGISALAKQSIQLGSVEESIRITAPKEITFEVNGSSLQLSSSGIVLKTKGVFDVQSSQSTFKGASGGQVQLKLPPSPKRGQGILELLNTYNRDQGVKNGRYTLVDNLGKETKGQLNDQGQAEVTGLPTGFAKVYFEPDSRDPWRPDSDFKRQTAWPPANTTQPQRTSLLGRAFKKISEPHTLNQLIENTKKVKSDGLRGVIPLMQETMLNQENLKKVIDGIGSNDDMSNTNTSTSDVIPINPFVSI